MITKKILMVLNCFLLIRQSAAQAKVVPSPQRSGVKPDTTLTTISDRTKDRGDQIDLVDVGLTFLHKNIHKRTLASDAENKKLRVSAAPILEYTLSTGFVTGSAANGRF